MVQRKHERPTISSIFKGVTKKGAEPQPCKPVLDLAIDEEESDRMDDPVVIDPLPPDEFLRRYCEHASESLCNAYQASHPIHYSERSGTVTSTLCEDVFSLVNVQINVLDDYLVTSDLLQTETGDGLLIDGLLCIIRNLRTQHMDVRDQFLGDMEQSCATANDFYSMMEKVEQLMAERRKTYPHLEWDAADNADAKTAVLQQEASELISLCSSDAVYAVQRAHSFAFQEINKSAIATALFSQDWEEGYIHNEVALLLVKTIEDYLYDFQTLLCNELLYRKVVDAMVRAFSCFYIRCLVHKAEKCRRHLRKPRAARKRSSPFTNPITAVCRMMYDIQVFQRFFSNLANQVPPVARVIENELSTLVVVHECLGAAASNTCLSNLEGGLIVVLHKRMGGNLGVTKQFLRDLWFLAATPSKRNSVLDILDKMQPELQAVTAQMREKSSNECPSKRDPLQGLKVDEMLQHFYEDRILQDQSTVCIPHLREKILIATKDSKKPRSTTQPKSHVFVPLDIDYESILPGLHGRLLELLKLHNLRFVKEGTEIVDNCSCNMCLYI